MRVFEMVLRVAAPNLTTVLDVLKDSADLVSMKQVEAELSQRVRKPNSGGKRAKGIVSNDIVREAVSGGKSVTMDGLKKMFVAKGFAATSAPPCINGLVRSGQVKKVGDGIYQGIQGVEI